MNHDSQLCARPREPDKRPILIVPYMWVGDFVRGHSVVTLLRERFPDRPVDLLATRCARRLPTTCPASGKTVVVDLPRGRIALSQQFALARRLRREGYGGVLVLPRTWKSALAPFLAGIPRAHRIFRRRARAADQRSALRRMEIAAHHRPLRGAGFAEECRAAARLAAAGSQCPGRARSPPGKENTASPATGRWLRWRRARSRRHGVGRAQSYAALSHRLLAEGCDVFVLGGPNEKPLAREIVGDTRARDLTGNDIRDAVLALAAAAAAVANDSGLLHVAAALGTPSIGIFGPMTAALWAPLNPLAAAIEINGVPAVPAMQSKCLPARPSPLPARHQPGHGVRRHPRRARGARKQRRACLG